MMDGSLEERNVAINSTKKLWKLTNTLTRVIGPENTALFQKILPTNPIRALKNSMSTKSLRENKAREKSPLTFGKANKENAPNAMLK